MRPRALTALLVALTLAGSLAPGAQAAPTRSVCARTAVLYDSPPPHAFVIARLSVRDRLQVKARTRNRRWVLVATRHGMVGWVSSKSLCRA